ncbi:RidA family protein [Chloroflexota bacterium]
MSTKEIIKPGSWPFYDYEKYPFSLAVKKGGLLFISGLSAGQYDSSLKEIACTGDVASQARVIYQKLKLILEAAGASFADVVKTVDYIAPDGLKDYKEVGRVRREYFADSFSAATGVVVDQLLRLGMLLEVECIAVLGKARKEKIASTHPRYQKLTYREGVQRGNILCVSGTGAAHPVTREMVGIGDVGAQARQIYEKIKAVLQEAGASFDDVVKTVDYLAPAGLADYKEVGRVRREYFTDTFPVSTGVIVNQLLRSEMLLEVDCIAVLGDARKEMIASDHPRYQKLTYREGVRKGNILCVSGTGAAHPVTREMVGIGDVVAQTRQTYEKMKTVLQAGGASFDDVVKTVDYIAPAGLKDYKETGEVRREYFSGTFPAAAGVAVNLLRPEMLIEIDCIAVLD